MEQQSSVDLGTNITMLPTVAPFLLSGIKEFMFVVLLSSGERSITLCPGAYPAYVIDVESSRSRVEKSTSPNAYASGFIVSVIHSSFHAQWAPSGTYVWDGTH